MSTSAHVASIEALETFRARLLVYLEKSEQALDEAIDETKRTRDWLQTAQRQHWTLEYRRRASALEEAQQALMSARLSTLRDSTEAEKRAVGQAKERLQEAQDKLQRIKVWTRTFDGQVEPLAREVGKLRQYLSADMHQGAAFLAQIIKTLQAYSEHRGAPRSPGSGPVADENKGEGSSDETKSPPPDGGAP